MMVNTMIAKRKHYIQFYILSIVLFFKEFADLIFQEYYITTFSIPHKKK